MKRVEHIYPVILADDHDNILSDRNKFGMRHRKLPAVGQMDDERFKPVRDAISNMLNIHKQIIYRESCDFKVLFSLVLLIF